ncbi:MAG: hypothetical protein GWP66_02730 [Gammaproteobacteria bacterium]|jgi:uncharacterized membrane protein|nr:hypothetical protein [Gammaproteobacteria bacterium]
MASTSPQKGLIAVSVLLFVVPMVAWTRGLPLGLLMVIAGFFALRALDARSRRIALWAIALTGSIAVALSVALAG